jgi:light-regulated signal transduction histidine kinase (bacteriophytochrome)
VKAARDALPGERSGSKREVLWDLQGRLAETGGTFHVESLPAIEADPTQMRQLFLNLIGNALKVHRKEKPVVKVHGHAVNAIEDVPSKGAPPSHYCRVYVEENGTGFDERDAELIFAPFSGCTGGASMRGREWGLPSAKRSSSGTVGSSRQKAHLEKAQSLLSHCH